MTFAEHLLRALRVNAGSKLLALLLALGTFYAVRATTSWEIRVDAPVDVRVDKGVAVLPPDPTTVSVTLRGAREEIERLDREAVRVTVRPRAADPENSEEEVALGPTSVEGAGRLRVTRVEPPRVLVRFDREEVRALPVYRPRFTGTPLRGRADAEYEPQQVLVRGSHRGLRAVQGVDTEPVDVDGRVQSFTKRVRVLPPSDTWVSSIEPPEVTVRVTISARTVERVWTNLPVRAVLKPGDPARVAFDPPEVSVVVRGGEDIVEAISDGAVQVFVDCLALPPRGTNVLDAVPHVPAGLDVTAETRPAKVRVTLDPQ